MITAKKMEGPRSVASFDHGTTRRSSLQIWGAALVVLRDRVPVDHVPPGLDVISSAVLVKEVISVLPDVESEHRFVALHQWAVLARSGNNCEFSRLILDQPDPAATKTLGAGVRKFFLERSKASKGGFD